MAVLKNSLDKMIKLLLPKIQFTIYHLAIKEKRTFFETFFPTAIKLERWGGGSIDQYKTVMKMIYSQRSWRFLVDTMTP